MSAIPANEMLPHLADYFQRRREQILDAWMSGVRSDRRIKAADHLSDPVLKDHFPDLLDDLCEKLRAGLPDATASMEEDRDAQTHGLERWRQGYRLDELLWEITELRSVLVATITEFESEEFPISSDEDRALVRIALHRFLDDLGWRSAQRYVDEQQAELRRSNEARAQLMRTVAHELRNMLDGFGLVAQLMEEGVTGAQQMQVMLERNIRHMRDLLDDLLDLSALVAGQKAVKAATFSADGILREIATIYRPTAEAKGLKFTAEVDPALGLVESDELKVKQIATNLVSNALKYTAQGEVKLTFRGIDNEHWMIAVEDTGIGIPIESQQQIFTEFYRGAEGSHVRGVGLGLSIVTRLVELLGGKIHLQSEPTKGSRFEVLLPRVLSSTSAPRVPYSPHR